jgi:hypothetical protein
VRDCGNGELIIEKKKCTLIDLICFVPDLT